MRLKVATYNTYRERKGRDEALDGLLREDRTLIFLQEVSISRAWEIKKRFGRRAYISPVMFGWEFLVTMLPEDARFIERRAAQLNSCLGLIPKEWSMRRVRALYPGRRHGWPDGLSPRAAQVARILWGGHEMRVMNTHLPYEPWLRDRCLSLLPELVGEGDTLLAGDLNATPGDLFLLDLLLTTGLKMAGSEEPTHNSGRRIDYVLYQGRFQEMGYSMKKSRSDHRLVRAELEVS